MESIFSMILSLFSFHFLSILLVMLLSCVAVFWGFKHIMYKRKIHERLLEIAFERALTNEKSRLI